MGWECHTKDVYEREGRIPDVILFLNIPHKPLHMLLDTRYKITKRWAILQECVVVRKVNWSSKAQAQFSKLFTWNDALVDNMLYFKLNFAQNIPNSVARDTQKQKLCTMIVANKHSCHHLELYSERLSAIRWFEDNHPEDFTFYGFGWDNKTIIRRILQLLQKYEFRKDRFKCYQGTVEHKTSILKQYKFAICYENARDIPGYITEKIIDCFIAGCIPVYLGANNITEHIPRDCLIDKRLFNNYADLYAYLRNMDDSTYHHYLKSIDDFLASSGARRFSSTFFAEVICNALAEIQLA